MKKTKLLWISSSPPCKELKHAGGKTFYYYFNQFKESEYFDIRLISFSDELSQNVIDRNLADINHKIVYKDKFNLKKLCNITSSNNPFHKYAGMLSNYYAMKTKEFLNEYKSEGYEPDVVILEWTNILLMIDEVKKIFPKAYYVASEHDVSFIGAKRQASYYKGLEGILKKINYQTLKKCELNALKQCDLIMPHNRDNIEVLSEYGISKNKCQWLIPYFFDMLDIHRNTNNKDILFYGAMNRKENYLSAEWFIKNVMPLLDNYDIRFIILGNKPPEYLKKYESNRVHFTGFVDDIRPYFENSCCLVAPLVLGAGIKVKILEAFSAGIPVLTNKVGIEGIPATNNKEYLFCESPEEYKQAIIKILEDKKFSENLENGSRKFIKKIMPSESAKAYINSVRKMVEKNDNHENTI